MSAWRSARTAAHDVLARPALWPIALAGFLARGGILLFIAPVVIPPSLVGLATFIGPASITPTGPTAGLILRIGLGTVLLAAAVLLGTIAAALAEVALIAAADGAPGRIAPGVVRRVVLIRLVTLLPAALALVLGIQRLGQIVYLELTLPTDLVTPLPIRVAAQAPGIVAAIVLAWLAGETWGGLATRLAVLRGAGVRRALLGGLGLFGRRLVNSLALLVVSVVVAIAVLGPAIGLIGWSWDLVRDNLLDASAIASVPAVIGATILFASCWLVGLVMAGALAAWRGVAWTLVVGEDHRGSGEASPERATL